MEKEIWFPAKRYGWGWGLPCAWQGWLVLFLWLALLCSGAVLLATRVILFVAYAIVLALALITVCLIKGEKPRWRCGKDKTAEQCHADNDAPPNSLDTERNKKKH